jgi:archaeal type IV pilus assembly protein PilA
MVKCSNCGSDTPHGKFCERCGAQLVAVQSNQSMPQSETSQKNGIPQITVQQRNPWVALILSLFFAGWGQWYNGRTWDGLKFFGAFLGSYVLLFICTIVMVSSQNLAVSIFVIILYVVLLGIWVYGMYNAYKTAEKINRGELEFAGKSGLFWLPVILFVLAIVIVISAAVIAAFVFGMAGNIQSTKVVGVTLQLDKNNYGVATLQGGSDFAKLNRVTYSINGGTETGLFSGSNLVLGKSATTSPNTVKGKRVVIIGYFTDGSKQVLVDTQL